MVFTAEGADFDVRLTAADGADRARGGRRDAGLRPALPRAGHGRVGGSERPLDALGQRTHVWGVADWDRMELGADGRGVDRRGPRRGLQAVRPPGRAATTPTAVSAWMLGDDGPQQLAEARLSTTYDDAGRQRRAGLELWEREDERATRAASPARSCAARRFELGRAAAGLRVLPLPHGRPRGRRPLRRAAARVTGPIKAVVSDFGGVLTSPLFAASSRASRRTPACRSRRSARRWRASPRADGVHPLYELETGKITEQRFIDAAREAVSARARAARCALHGFADALLARPGTNDELVAYLRDAARARVRLAMLTNNVREWEPRWRAMLPVDELFELVVDSAFVGMRKPDAGSTSSRSSASGCRPRRACSSTTSSTTARPPPRWGCTRCGSATPTRPSRSSRQRLPAERRGARRPRCPPSCEHSSTRR